MANERLRAAMAAAQADVDRVADETGVDPKTVQRWLNGRVPHRRHRLAVAALLREEEAYLWPKLRGVDREAGQADSSAEILAAYPHRASAPLGLWRGLLERCQRRIDAVACAMLFLPEQHPDFAQTVAAKCANGARVRIALSDPDGEQTRVRDQLEDLGGTLPARIRTTLKYFQPLGSCAGVEVRLHDWHLYSAIYRFDDDMLVTPYLAGAHGFQHPLLHLRRLGPYGLFEGYAGQFERIWQSAVPLQKATSQGVLA